MKNKRNRLKSDNSKYHSTPKEKKSVHLKIFITIFISICVSIIILTIVLYTYFERIILDKIFDSERNSLYQAGLSIKLMRELSKNIAVQIFNDYSLSALLYVPETDQVEIYRALNSLKKYNNLISYIHSIYLYNPRIDTYYINSPAPTSMIQPGELFFDKEIKILLDNPEYISSLKPLPRVIREPGTTDGFYVEKNVYTYIFNLYGKKSEVKTSIIINISEDWLRGIIDSLDVNPENKALIIDPNGRLMSGFGNSRLLSLAPVFQFIKGQIAAGNKSGYSVTTINGTEYFLVFSRIEVYDWILVKQIPYRQLMNYVLQFQRNMLIISVCLLVLGVISSVFLAKGLYKPFDRLLNDLRFLEKKRKTDENTLKSYSMNRILEQSALLNNHEINRIMDDLAIGYEIGDRVGLLLLEIDRYRIFADNHSRREQQLLKIGILETVHKLVGEHYMNEGIDCGGVHVAVIMNAKNGQEKRFLEIIRETAVLTQKEIQRKYGISVSVTIGPPAAAAGDISVLFQKAIDASKKKFFLGFSAVICVAENYPLPSDAYVYPIHEVEELINALNSGNMVKITSLYQDIVSFAKTFGYERVINTIDDLAQRTAKIAQTINLSNDSRFSFDLDEFLSNLKNTETLTEVDGLFHSFFSELGGAVSKRIRTKKHILINAVIERIDRDYPDSNMSIAFLADEYHVSAAYLGRLFHDHIGKSMPDYINTKRIEQAAVFLSDNSLPISEIMKMTGFSNKTHFYSMFKKYNTVTPNEYRFRLTKSAAR